MLLIFPNIILNLLLQFKTIKNYLIFNYMTYIKFSFKKLHTHINL